MIQNYLKLASNLVFIQVLQVISFLLLYFFKMMYTRFIFGDFKKKLNKNRHLHPYGVFKGPLGSSLKDEFGWMSKLHIQQTRLTSKLTDESLHMVALLPRSGVPTLPRLSSPNKNSTDTDEFPILWENMPSSFELNFAAINPDTRRPYSAYSFPYFLSYF